MKKRTTLYRAASLVVDKETIIDEGALLEKGGKVVAVGRAEEMNQKADRVVDYGQLTLHPGFVNAHCHLDLSFLGGKIPARLPFPTWLDRVVTARRTGRKSDIDAAIHDSIKRLFAGGVTTVGDISATDRSANILAEEGMRGVVFHEVLGFQKALWRQRLDGLMAQFKATPRSPLLTAGVSPHALYSTSARLIKETARFGRAQKAPLAIHAGETLEEDEFCRKGTGPLADFLDHLGANEPGGHPGASPVKALSAVAALKGALLIHGAHLGHGAIAAMVKAKAKLVYCPGANRFFGRDDSGHPLPKLVKKGVTVALGTDSLASNADLDMAAEGRLTRKNFPTLSARDIFSMLTVGGAQALSLPPLYGTLRPGAPFDAVVAQPGGRGDLFERLIHPGRRQGALYVNGRRRYHDSDVTKSAR